MTTEATTTPAPRSERARTRIPYRVEVLRVEQLSPGMKRIVFGGADLARFNLGEATDSYVKVVFLSAGIDYPEPLDLAALSDLPGEQRPRLRTYTVRAFDTDRLELTLDFVVHGDSGLAGPWAAQAQVGDTIHLLGPGGGYQPSPSAGWYLLVGDESALPAIAVAAERLAAENPQAQGQILLEVHDAAEQLEFVSPLPVTWLHRGDAPVGEAVVEAVAALEIPSGTSGVTVEAFVHGEAGFVKQLRRLLLSERGVERDRLSISGYWRLGADDEAWRAAKAEWAKD